MEVGTPLHADQMRCDGRLGPGPSHGIRPCQFRSGKPWIKVLMQHRLLPILLSLGGVRCRFRTAIGIGFAGCIHLSMITELTKKMETELNDLTYFLQIYLAALRKVC